MTHHHGGSHGPLLALHSLQQATNWPPDLHIFQWTWTHHEGCWGGPSWGVHQRSTSPTETSTQQHSPSVAQPETSEPLWASPSSSSEAWTQPAWRPPHSPRPCQVHHLWTVVSTESQLLPDLPQSCPAACHSVKHQSCCCWWTPHRQHEHRPPTVDHWPSHCSHEQSPHWAPPHQQAWKLLK